MKRRTSSEVMVDGLIAERDRAHKYIEFVQGERDMLYDTLRWVHKQLAPHQLHIVAVLGSEITVGDVVEGALARVRLSKVDDAGDYHNER